MYEINKEFAEERAYLSALCQLVQYNTNRKLVNVNNIINNNEVNTIN